MVTIFPKVRIKITFSFQFMYKGCLKITPLIYIVHCTRHSFILKLLDNFEINGTLPIDCQLLQCLKERFRNILYIYRVIKKCDFRRLVQNCTFFVQLSCMVFFQYFWKICNSFGTPMAQKKYANLFFSQNQKFRKAKICIQIISIEI